MATPSMATGEPREVPDRVLTPLFDMSVPTAVVRWGEIVLERSHAEEEFVPGYPLIQIVASVDIVPHPRDAVDRLTTILSQPNGTDLLAQVMENELWRITYIHQQTTTSFTDMANTDEGRQQIVNDIAFEIGRRVTNELSKSLTSGTFDSETLKTLSTLPDDSSDGERSP